jgi:hypothetical protein
MPARTTAFTRLHCALAGQLFHGQPGVGAGGGEDAVALEERAKLGHDFLRRVWWMIGPAVTAGSLRRGAEARG